MPLRHIPQKQQAYSNRILPDKAEQGLKRHYSAFPYGKQHEARNMLVEVYNWFTEGFDTKDLQEAKTLLKELND
jgi:hypothetical protein